MLDQKEQERLQKIKEQGERQQKRRAENKERRAAGDVQPTIEKHEDHIVVKKRGRPKKIIPNPDIVELYAVRYGRNGYYQVKVTADIARKEFISVEQNPNDGDLIGVLVGKISDIFYKATE